MVANLLLSTLACRPLKNPFRIMIQMRYSRVRYWTSRRRRPCSGFSRGGLSALSRLDLFVVDSPLSCLQNVCFRISRRCSFFRLVLESSQWLAYHSTSLLLRSRDEELCHIEGSILQSLDVGSILYEVVFVDFLAMILIPFHASNPLRGFQAQGTNFDSSAIWHGAENNDEVD